MRRRWTWIALVSLALLSAVASPARAATVAELIQQLRSSDDYRVRTQAALSLGTSGDDAAVQPLCGALGDANLTVKVAAAAALGKLGKPAGLPCLKAAQAKETAPTAKAQIDKSIAQLEGGSGAGSVPAPPPPGADTKFYVAIQVSNKTSRSAAEVETMVRGAMQEKLLAAKGYAVAPKSETPAQGGQIVKGKKLKGFYLIATVEAPVYAGGDLSQTVRVSMWTYPDKALQGEFAPKFVQNGTPKADPQGEAILVKMCVEAAVEKFQKVAASL
jgi:hypothetical protein